VGTSGVSTAGNRSSSKDRRGIDSGGTRERRLILTTAAAACAEGTHPPLVGQLSGSSVRRS
jgi:hypothetical protein